MGLRLNLQIKSSSQQVFATNGTNNVCYITKMDNNVALLEGRGVFKWYMCAQPDTCIVCVEGKLFVF